MGGFRWMSVGWSVGWLWMDVRGAPTLFCFLCLSRTETVRVQEASNVEMWVRAIANGKNLHR